MAESNTDKSAPGYWNTTEGKKKLLADTAKAEAETAQVKAQIEALLHGEARDDAKHKAEMSILDAAIQTAKDQVTVSGIVTAREKRHEEQLLTDDRHHFTYSFTQQVGPSSVRECIAMLTEWVRRSENLAEKPPIQVIFDSPGGSVIDGMHLWDFLTFVKEQGHHLTTIAFGMAASMAGILLQAGDTRVLGRESYLLIHEVSFGAHGKPGEVEDEVKFVRKIQKRVLDIFAENAADALIKRGDRDVANRDAVIKERRAKIDKNWQRTDWWLDSTECLEFGLVDEVR
jgi:ATP-dependent protease ClpP protease subunit